ncbi:MAG: very short patch repair endonuclease [Acidaminococcaceae bacterium]
MDKISKDMRSKNMSQIKSKNTTIELIVRRLLHANGYRYRIHYKDVIGNPDLFMRKYNTAIFINGCFWHRHEGCKRKSSPKTNVSYWSKKLDNNLKRDRRVYEELNKEGIAIIIIWECTIKKLKNEAFINAFLHDFKTAIEGEKMLVEI